MALFKKDKEDAQGFDAAISEDVDVDEVMRKYDKESNTRIWEGVPKVCCEL